MSECDKLREFVGGADGYELWCPHHKRELEAIADCIDAKIANLHKQVDYERDHYECALGNLHESLKERDMLHDLCREMYVVIKANNVFWDYRLDETHAFLKRMQDLGIEVKQ